MHIIHVNQFNKTDQTFLSSNEFNKTDQTFLSLQDFLVLNPKKKQQSLGSFGMKTVFITLSLMI